ncbi:MAG: hypothetical protein NC402_07980 [Prevotella sp.]|nr:hypothetical protein [Prevotella sp.]MCM1075678.1 hypothetical protein [Ruminococcus sp.]
MRKLFTLAAAAVCTLSAFAAESFTAPVIVDPANGSIVTELSSVTIKPNADYDYVEIASREDISVEKDGAPFCGITWEYTDDNETSVKVTLAKTATEPGEYTINFPEYSWEVSCFEGSENEGYYCNPMTLTYTISGGQAVNSSVTVSPASGSTVTAPFESITFTSNVDGLPEVSAETIYEVMVQKDGKDFCGVKGKTNSDRSCTLTFKTPATENGTYTISLPTGALALYSEDYTNMQNVDAMTLTYTVGGGAEPKPEASLTINPEPGTITTPLSSFTIASGVEGYDVEINSADDIKVLKDGEDFCGVTRKNLTFTLKEPMTESTVYTIVIPADSYYLYKFVGEEDIEELPGVEQKFVYTAEIGGPKYTIVIPEGKLTPNSVDDGDPETVDAADLNTYDGQLSEFYLNNIKGELYAKEGATVNVYCKRVGYNVNATVTAAAPVKGALGMTTKIYFKLPTPITTDGTYTITIPKGIFGTKDYVETGNGEANKAAAFEVTFTGGLPEPEPTVKYDLGLKNSKPAEGKVDMSKFTWEVTQLMIDANYDLAENSTKEATLVCEALEYNSGGVIKPASNDGFTRTLKFANKNVPDTKSGTYIMTIPEGTFGDAEWREDPETGHTNPEIKVYFMVDGGSVVSTVYDLEVASVTPENESSVNIAENPLAISFTANGELSYYPSVKASLTSEDAQYNGTVVIASAATAEGITTFTLALDTPVTVNGDYTLTLPEGIFGDADYLANWTTGHASKAFTSTFTVTGGEQQAEPAKYDLMPTLNPESGSQLVINEEVKITFTFPAGTTPTNDSPRASMKCPDANYFATAIFQKGETDGSFYLRYGTNPKRIGTYTIDIPEGLFFNKEMNSYNPAFTITYNITDTAIDSIISDENADVEIFNLNGVYVGKNINELPAGIYLTKGKKVIVK